MQVTEQEATARDSTVHEDEELAQTPTADCGLEYQCSTEQEAMTPNMTLQNVEELAQNLTANSSLEHQRGTGSRLLDLPPELRNRIYYYTALDAVGRHASNPRYGAPGLLAVCRQVRQEFSSLYFSDAIMTMERLTWGHEPIGRWLTHWEPVTDLSIVKALFQQKAGRQIDHISRARARSVIRFIDVYTMYGAPLGDVQQARHGAERLKIGDYQAVTGIVVFAAASGGLSRAIVEYDYRY